VAEKVSVIVPCLNEEENIRPLYDRVRLTLDAAGVDWELIFSLDPCTDRTEDVIGRLSSGDGRVKMLRLSRRFGQPAATIAGMSAAGGDAVIVIDCDLQDPPELMADLIAKWREGFDVVYAQRRTREGETVVKRMVAYGGYKVIKRVAEVEIPPNTGDFRLMSRRVVDEVLRLGETHGFLRGLVAVVGFRQAAVQYDRDPRAAGEAHYNRFLGSMRIGLNGLVGFSRYPLQVISLLGLVVFALAMILAIVYVALKIAGVDIVWGNPTTVIIISFFSGIQLLSLGVMGEYVGRIYDEVKHRPMYIVDVAVGFDGESPRPNQGA
jgi:glycosyltransferase involved in cell wall biosynthesis